jgi:hypothetical protein
MSFRQRKNAKKSGLQSFLIHALLISGVKTPEGLSIHFPRAKARGKSDISDIAFHSNIKVA